MPTWLEFLQGFFSASLGTIDGVEITVGGVAAIMIVLSSVFYLISRVRILK